jgi:hypothetical protein
VLHPRCWCYVVRENYGVVDRNKAVEINAMDRFFGDGSAFANCVEVSKLLLRLSSHKMMWFNV